ncbi:MAG: hypothetical protein AAF604_00780 [Acidobacteriota bacterium]
MGRRLEPILGILALLIFGGLLSVPAAAAFRANVTRADGFSPRQVQRVVVATRQCHEVVDCSAMEQRVVGEMLELGVPFAVVAESRVRKHLFEQGTLEYVVEQRQSLADAFEADAVLELAVPFAERGDGFGGRRRSSVKVEIFLLRPDGELLLHGVGTGRPLNVVSGPERVTGNVVETILRKAFGSGG